MHNIIAQLPLKIQQLVEIRKREFEEKNGGTFIQVYHKNKNPDTLIDKTPAKELMSFQFQFDQTFEGYTAWDKAMQGNYTIICAYHNWDVASLNEGEHKTETINNQYSIF